MKAVNVLDLFSGVGGFSIGLERAGFRTVGFCEIDPFCQRVLAERWPLVEVHGDITKRGFVEGEADVITAGFPCQDISFAGEGAGLAGTRSGLYRHVIRALRLVRPRWAVLENVAALLSRGLDTVLGDMAEVGYDAEWHCIPASAVGAPHRRDRVWIIANPGGKQHEGNRAPLSGEIAAQLSEATAEPNSEGLSIARPESPGENGRHAGRGSAAGNWWAAEPDVGRVVYGIPSELDRGSHGKEEHATEAGAQGNGRDHGMPSMRSDGRTGAASPGLFESGAGRGSVPILPHQGGPTGWHEKDQGAEELRVLRKGIYADAQQEAHAMQSGMSRDRWPHERGEALGQIWSTEPSIGRVARGVANRVDRLRSLGNSVVPQVVEIIGRAILNAKNVQ